MARPTSIFLASTVLGLVVFLGSCASPGKQALEQAAKRSGGLHMHFEGARSFGREELLGALAKELEDLSSDGLDRPDVDDLAYVLEVFYRRRGFPDAFVSYDLERLTARDGGAGPLEARFRIEEGRRVHVESFVLNGNRPRSGGRFSDDQLRAFFSPPSGLFEEETWWYDPTKLNQGRSALENYYRSEGFLSVEVGEPQITWIEDYPIGTDRIERAAVRVRIDIREGPRWVLDRSELELVGPLSDKRRATLERLLEDGRRDRDGRLWPYTLRLAYGLRARLLERLGQWGHVDADCDVEEVELEPGRMLVRFSLNPGPVVRVGTITPRGNEKTRSTFLLRRLSLSEGDVVTSDKLRSSFQRLFSTGLFRTVSLDLGSEGAEAEEGEVRRDLVVEVLELPSIEVSVEPGYGSYEGPRLRLGIEDSNILGTGRTGEVRATIGALAQKLTLGLGDRSLFDSEYAGSSVAYVDHREEPSFTLQEEGLGLSIARAWGDGAVEAALGLRFRRTKVSDIQVVDATVQDALSNIDISSLTFTLARDRRDNFFAPTRGSFARAQVEWASSGLGSEIDFVSTTLEYSLFRPLPWAGGVLGLGIETSLITPLADTDDLPLQVRKFNGGENSVRSFREDELGNLDVNGEPIGGEAYTTLTLELRQRLAGPLSGALFFDAGNLEPNHEQYLNFDDMRQALGIGLRYALPIGPVRLDAGWNPDPREQEDDWVLHLSVGMSF